MLNQWQRYTYGNVKPTVMLNLWQCYISGCVEPTRAWTWRIFRLQCVKRDRDRESSTHVGTHVLTVRVVLSVRECGLGVFFVFSVWRDRERQAGWQLASLMWAYETETERAARFIPHGSPTGLTTLRNDCQTTCTFWMYQNVLWIVERLVLLH